MNILTKRGPTELLLPIAVRFDLVDKDSTVRPAVPCQVRLAVAIKIESTGATATLDWIFPDRAAHDATLPLDLAW